VAVLTESGAPEQDVDEKAGAELNAQQNVFEDKERDEHVLRLLLIAPWMEDLLKVK